MVGIDTEPSYVKGRRVTSLYFLLRLSQGLYPDFFLSPLINLRKTNDIKIVS